MKLKCNVCYESPIVDVAQKPKFCFDLVVCPVCDKQLAFADIERKKLIWRPIDTHYNKEVGIIPVTVISL